MRAHIAHEAGPGRAASGLFAAIAAALLAGACSSASPNGPMASLDSLLGSSPSEQRTRDGSAQAAAPRSELDKAIAHWGKEYKDKPHDLKVALAYARNLKAAGHKDQAFGVLQASALLHGDSKELASEYGRMALEYDQVGVAEKLLAMADDPTKPDWKLVSARGTVLAKQGKFTDAIPFYERALALAPGQPSVLNNLAMAHAANGEPAKAEQILRTASSTSRDPKLKQNLALVMGLQGKHDEAKTFAAEHLPAEQATANVEYVRAMVKPQAAPQATPAVMTNQSAQTAPAAKSAKGNARMIEAKNAPAQGMRPSGGPSDVPGTGGWSTTVQVSR